MSSPTTRGVLYVHSAPQALCPHIQWALESVSHRRTDLQWTPQNAEPGCVRTELEWSGRAGTGALLASALRTLGRVRFEVTENASQGSDGSRWSFTPDLGIFHATTDVAGNICVSEDRIRYAFEAAGGDPSAVVSEPWVRRGTRSSNRSVTLLRELPSAGCTASADALPRG